jgi:hypothetical protein
MIDDALEAFIHGDCLSYERVFQFSTTESDRLKKALASSNKSRLHFSDFQNEQKSLVVKRFYYICQSRIDENMNKLRPECRTQIGFCFVESTWLNARVCRAEDGTSSILMNDALIPFLFNFWQRAVEKGELNASIDDVSGPDRKVWISPEKLIVLWNNTELTDIKDPCLRYYLWECIRVGLEAIVDHEFGHIVRGHQRLHQSSNPIIKEFEIASQAFSENEALHRQTIELDADSFAAHRAIWSFLNRGNRSQHAHAEAPCNQYYRNIKHAYRTLCLSLYVSFRMFGPYHDQVKDMQTRRHPPIFIRFVQACATVTRFLNRVPNLAGKLDEFQDLAFFEVAYCDITGLPFDDSLGDFWLTDQCLAYSLILIRNLDKVFYQFDNSFSARPYPTLPL